MERIEYGNYSNAAEEQSQAITTAYDYFNRQLFGGILPSCIINFSRRKNTDSFLIPQRWKSVSGSNHVVHEIMLTSASFHLPLIIFFGCLVHEMVHLWQWEFGEPSRNGYHNKQWANKMESIGLMPSHTGQLDGKRTGQYMNQYVIENGFFQKAFKAMSKKCILPFTTDLKHQEDKDKIRAKLISKGRRKTKYTCSCGINIWGKPNLNIICGNCNEVFQFVPLI